MKKKSSQLRQTEQQETATHQTSSAQGALEFASAEEMLRFDAAQTVVPTQVTERLQESIAAEPKPRSAAWWQRWFRRRSGSGE